MAQDRTDAELTQFEPGQSDAEDDGSGRRRPSTIIDVANEAGVAIGTVSRYLNGLSVRPGNRDLIETAIQRLGYRRNALAAAMKSDLTNTVGFMVPSLSEFHSAMLEQLSRAAAHRRPRPAHLLPQRRARIDQRCARLLRRPPRRLPRHGRPRGSRRRRPRASVGRHAGHLLRQRRAGPAGRSRAGREPGGERARGRPPARHRPHAHRGSGRQHATIPPAASGSRAIFRPCATAASRSCPTTSSTPTGTRAEAMRACCGCCRWSIRPPRSSAATTTWRSARWRC